MQYSRSGLMTTEQRERITSLELLAVLLLIQPRMQLATLAVRADVFCCWLMLWLPDPQDHQSPFQRAVPQRREMPLCSGLTSSTDMVLKPEGSSGPADEGNKEGFFPQSVG